MPDNVEIRRLQRVMPDQLIVPGDEKIPVLPRIGVGDRLHQSVAAADLRNVLDGCDTDRAWDLPGSPSARRTFGRNAALGNHLP
jgi:hypothetical protein